MNVKYSLKKPSQMLKRFYILSLVKGYFVTTIFLFSNVFPDSSVMFTR